MEEKIVEIVKKQVTDISEKKISRKEAIKRTGYIAASAATMMVLLSKQSQAHGSSSEPAPCPKPKPGGGGDKPKGWH